ncbi:condensin complex component [Micromonas commoda]|uniref:Structural maintenance of chromosomes protein n=1 Tax=Micromonas commoda (strain RCC299 / NOUM17 / CCMP2709) TaxID=296587 RepID=C1DZG1_MICCC|nr:condensin complex component [Micromonas commoda]ACO61111.1 condensin complex component [Micromonas commoda]|eukprot:XP_002499853.1 condensin complex component [Micromonas commoda]
MARSRSKSAEENNTAVAVRGGMISRIECDNFKSYKGHQVIGPFKQFTSIIGPNGSGKSNLMDAISFVLGVQSAQLRGTVLRDLVYAFDLADREESRTAYVKLFYEAEDGTEICFSRHIDASGAGQYKIDGKTCTAEAYSERLKEHGILIKARNFLVFQGDIESVASKSPKELCALVEQVSGSADLKKDYDDALKLRKECEEEQLASLQRRKATTTLRKQMKEQKEEAEKHIRMQEELTKLKTEHVMFKLYHIDHEAERHTEEIEEAKEALKEHEDRLNALKKEEEEKRQLKAGHSKRVMMLERKIAKAKEDADKRNPAAVKNREETLRAKKKLELAQKMLERHSADAEQSATDIARLERDLKNVAAAEEIFENDFQAELKKGDKKQLGAAQVEDYNRKKEEAGAKTFKLRQERDGLAAAAQADEDVRKRLEAKRDELTQRVNFLNEQKEGELRRMADLEKGRDEAKAELDEARTKDKGLADEKRKSRAKQEHLTNKIEEISGKLREAKADRKESEREVRAQEAIVAMRRLLPGVHGRVTDLLKVTQRKYNLAIITVLGRDADAIVVDDAAVAKECVQYLKEQRVAPMTFLPLDGVKAYEPDEGLRHLGGSAKLAVDVCNFDSKFKVAMIYALGSDTIVCDTHEEAKRLTFGGERRFKVVSLDGTMIRKSGEMTGGTSGSLEAKASRFDAEEVATLRADRQAAEESLARLKPVATFAMEEQEAQARMTRLERDLQYAAADIKVCAEKIGKLSKDVEVMEREIASTVPELEKATAELEKTVKAARVLEKKIHAIEDEVYAEFSKSVGVKNIREYEENNLATLQRGAEERAKFAQQKAKLTEQLNYERSRDVAGPRAKAESDITRHKEDLARLASEAEKAKAEADAARNETEGWEKDAAAAKEEMRAVEAEINELRARNKGANTDEAKLQRVVSNKTAQVEALRENRADIIAAARMERLKLPRADDDEEDEDILALPAPVPTLGDGNEEEAEEAEAMEVDAETTGGWRAAAFRVKLSYENLPDRLKNAPRPSDRERLDHELRDAVEEKAADLARLEPNMKAIEQYEGLKEKEAEQVEALEDSRRRTKEAAEAFDAVMQERESTFMAAFEHISGAIDRVYKELTSSRIHPMGGTAYLNLEDVQEPYNSGVRFSAMPPTKRFRDMDQLSGGEKTMAALALIFAIHSYRSSPFFILDEVDAALDKTNVEKMAQFIRNRSHGTNPGNEGKPCQSIVISLKDYFFDKADSLVGVCRDIDQACSRVLTFDLEKYPEEIEE